MILGPFVTLVSFFTLKFCLHTKDSELKAKMCSFCINKGEEQNHFMKANLSHNILNNNDKNERKIQTQVKISFTTNLRGKKSLKPCLLPMYVFIVMCWSHLEFTPLMGKLLLFNLSPFPFAYIFIIMNIFFKLFKTFPKHIVQ